ncbi:MAG: PilZ domain-containing protein [Desulfovibrionaceae bacterium]
MTLAKGDKPARRGAAPELPDDAETPKGFGISFNLDDTEAVNRKERRKCFRVGFPGLVANVAELGKKLKVRDVSVGGVALVCQARVKPGTRLTISLGLPPQTLFVSKVPATVIRCENGVLGLRFQDPDRHQEDGLHKVVLEAQKRAAELRRSKRTLPDEILNIKL